MKCKFCGKDSRKGEFCEFCNAPLDTSSLISDLGEEFKEQAQREDEILRQKRKTVYSTGVENLKSPPQQSRSNTASNVNVSSVTPTPTPMPTPTQNNTQSSQNGSAVTHRYNYGNDGNAQSNYGYGSYGNTQSKFGSAADSSFFDNSAPSRRHSSGIGGAIAIKVLTPILCFAIGIGAFFGVKYYKNNSTKVFDGRGGYSIEMPRAMEQVSSSELKSYIIDGYTNAGNMEMFIAEKLPYNSSLGELPQGLNTSDIYEAIKLAGSASPISVTACDGTFIKFEQNIKGKKYKGICKIVEKNGGYYMFQFDALDENYTDREAKYKEWLATVDVGGA